MHTKINDEMVETLRKHSRTMVRELGLLGDEYNKTGVTVVERHLMIELEACLFPTVGDVAEMLLLDKSTASRLVANLVKKGFVTHTLDEGDKRRRCLQLTKKGKQKLEDIKRLAQEQVRSALAALSLEEVNRVVEGLSLYAKGLRKARLRKDFAIERLQPQDNVALSQIIVSCLEEYGCNKAGFAAQDVELQSMFQAYQKPGCAYFVLKKGAKVNGGGGIAPLEGANSEICELRKMYLAPEARGMGFGDLLMKACLDEAKQLGYRSCYLETSKDMAQAQALYRKHGFNQVTKRKGCTGHFGCNCFFEKKL